MSERTDALNGEAGKKLRRMLEDWEANELAARTLVDERSGSRTDVSSNGMDL